MLRFPLFQWIFKEVGVDAWAGINAILLLLPFHGVIWHLYFIDAQSSSIISGFLLKRREKMQLDLFSSTECAQCICSSYEIYHHIICTACFNHTHPRGNDIMHFKKYSKQKILHTSTEILCLTYIEGTKRLLAISKLVNLSAKLFYTGGCLFQALCCAKKSLIPPVYLSNHILVWSNNVKAEHSRWCLDQ